MARPTSLELFGAPDELIGTPEGKSKPVQVMHIELSQAVLDELLECTRNGKPPQILFGRNPRLEYGNKSQTLEPTTENFRHELYRYNESDDDAQQWDFAGLVNHSLQLQKLHQSFESSDKALENLRNSIANINEQREAEKAIIATADISTSRNAKLPTKSSQLRTPALGGTSTQPNSPALSAIGSPAPKMFQANYYKRAALAKPAKAFLALGPATAAEVHSKTNIPKNDLAKMLEEIATKTDKQRDGHDLWLLNGRSFKELDFFAPPFVDEEQRKTAIENAIASFDRMRIPPDDVLWQKLLPENERGKGKILSKLKLVNQSGGVATPAMTAKQFKVDHKTGRPIMNSVKDKRPKTTTEEKKPGPKKDPGAKAADKPTKGSSATTKPPAARDRVTKKTSSSFKERAINKLTQAKVQKAPAAAGTPTTTSVKPKNPSPLSSSPPVNASDLEQEPPAKKVVASSVSPAKKRKADDAEGTASSNPANKVRKLTNGSAAAIKTPRSHASSISSVGRPPIVNSKDNGSKKTSPAAAPAQVNGASNHARRNTNTSSSTINTTATHAATSSSHTNSTSDSHSPSPPLRLSWRQQVEQGRKFKGYYDKYHKLYHQLADDPEPPSQAAREDLMRMHHRLLEMKREIYGGSLAA